MKDTIKKNWTLFLVVSLTLGLAPFRPPHIVGKVQWLLGGNAFSDTEGMKGMDWFDLFLHGTPWVLLLLSSILHAVDFALKKGK